MKMIKQKHDSEIFGTLGIALGLLFGFQCPGKPFMGV